MDASVLQLWRRLQTLTKLFRFVEIFTLIILLSWILIRLPFAVKISGEYLGIIAALVFSPTSVFLLGNAIVVSLLAKSGLFSANDVSSSAVDAAVAEFNRKLRSDSDDGDEHSETTPFNSPSHVDKAEVVFQDKEVIVCEPKVSVAVNFVNEEKTEEKEINYRRSKSEKIKSEFTKREETAKLRRSETDVYRKYVICGGDESTAKLIAEEEGEGGEGGEEFRRTIEEFIAKQVRFHREESLAVVLHGKA
ncbi:uncharacterized protein LOC141623048 [Silene latifolia]|uniref:uncharacterized protein LOC141623048 n=1 Tax=Silene latifolia TaxID=37657 RepID=UPI003D780C73